jgi:TatD DNase family protein
MEVYIDIHTHKQSAMGMYVINRHKDFAQAGDGTTCSMGIHSWYIQSGGLNEQLEELNKYAGLPNVIAIGECGLDKLTDTDWQLQLTAFEEQVRLASQLNKPLVIHCVRAYEEVLHILKAEEVQVPVIFHGYNKNIELAERLIKAGYYLSFGAALLKEGSNASTVLPSIPADRFFLETDDSPVDIADIYTAAASLLKTEPDALILQLQNNFHRVFNI